jgi:hypothetical protein
MANAMNRQWNRLFAFLLRDGAVALLLALLWRATLQQGAPHGAGPWALQLGTGLLTVFVGYLLHEWGHLIGAWLAGGHFVLPATVTETMFLFRFDNVRNSRGQFISMSLGGFVSSILVVVALVLALPRNLPASWLALGLTALGVAATLIIEVPEFLGVVRGGPMPKGAAFVSPPGTPADQAGAGGSSAL